MSKRTLKDSITRDSNPEGINQYTGGSAKLEKGKMNASSGAAFHHEMRRSHEASAQAHSVAGKTALSEAHMRAATQHNSAAKMYERAHKRYSEGLHGLGNEVTRHAEKYADAANKTTETLKSREKTRSGK